MATDDSSRRLFHRFRNGDSRAAGEVFDRYVSRLISLVRRRLSPQLQRRVDAEDVVQSAMRSFFVRAANEAFMLERAGDLWRLLATITLSKLRRQVEVHTAAKRTVAKEQLTASLDQLGFVVDREPPPGEDAALLDEIEMFMQKCSPSERETLRLRLAGNTIECIATSMGRSQRTVRRMLQKCRAELERKLLAEHQ